MIQDLDTKTAASKGYSKIAPVTRVRLGEDGEEGGYQGHLPAPGGDHVDAHEGDAELQRGKRDDVGEFILKHQTLQSLTQKGACCEAKSKEPPKKPIRPRTKVDDWSYSMTRRRRLGASCGTSPPLIAS